jgi:hypothetical protein
VHGLLYQAVRMVISDVQDFGIRDGSKTGRFRVVGGQGGSFMTLDDCFIRFTDYYFVSVAGDGAALFGIGDTLIVQETPCVVEYVGNSFLAVRRLTGLERVRLAVVGLWPRLVFRYYRWRYARELSAGSATQSPSE